MRDGKESNKFCNKKTKKQTTFAQILSNNLTPEMKS